MKYVIDSNQLQTNELREFLAKSPRNIAVLPDFVAMEAYKGDPLKTIFRSMIVLSDFPNQVFILKGSTKICGLSGRRKGLQRRFIDEDQTRGFPEYVRALRLAQAGNIRLRKQILGLGVSANDHFGKMHEAAVNSRGVIETLGRQFTKVELALLRSNETYTPELVDKVVRAVMEMAAMTFQDFGRRRPTYAELPNTFIFRVTFATYLLSLRRFAQGGFSDLNPEKLRNDFVDMMIVAYGTYFDGLMSLDRNVNHMFNHTSQLLWVLFDADIPSLLDQQAER